MANIIICSQCGSQCEEGTRFCAVCGAPIKHNSSSRSTTTTYRQTSNQPIATNVSVMITGEDAGAPSLYETLAQSKKKEDQYSTKSMPNVSFKVKPIPTTPKDVGRPKPVSRPRIKRSLVTPRKASDLSPEIFDKLKDLLKSLNKLDRNLEASAILRRDGTILASAVSDKVNNDIMATVGTVFELCSDSIKALSGGKLQLLTMTADNVLVMICFVNTDTTLFLVTSPKSQVGLISMYAQLVSQKIDKLV